MSKTKNSQIDNWKTYCFYNRYCTMLAENVFSFENIPNSIDMDYVNKQLVKNGSIAFFYDDVMNELLALPYSVNGQLDVYDRPLNITAIGGNGYSRNLKKDDFVIMYDNTGRYPLIIDIWQFAERLAIDMRTIDINVIQQRTPRIWQCKQGEEATLKRLINEIDSFTDVIKAYNNFDLEGISSVIAPAPFIADKVREEKNQIWNEFLSHIGITNVSFQKKERNIKDEIIASQGGTVASRFSRYSPRVNAINKINEKWGYLLEKEITVSYYDGIPTSKEENEIIENEVIEDDDF